MMGVSIVGQETLVMVLRVLILRQVQILTELKNLVIRLVVLSLK